MKRRSLILILLLPVLLGQSVSAHWEEHDVNGQYMFGYASVGEDPARYLTEVEDNHIPTNIQSLAVNRAIDDVRAKLSYLKAHGQRAILVLDSLLFLNDPELNTPCGMNAWRNRLDFKAKFDNWLNLNRDFITPEYVSVLVVMSEMNNRCVSYGALDTVTQYVTSKLPSIPVIAGYDGTNGAGPLPESIPPSLSGVLFFKYRVFDPKNDPAYQEAFNRLKSKLTPEQRILLIPDGYYDSSYEAMGWPKWYLGYVALNYMNLALSDPKVVGLAIFLWPGFQEFGEYKLGARDLPQSVRDKHRQVGCGLKIQSPQAVWCN